MCSIQRKPSLDDRPDRAAASEPSEVWGSLRKEAPLGGRNIEAVGEGGIGIK